MNDCIWLVTIKPELLILHIKGVKIRISNLDVYKSPKIVNVLARPNKNIKCVSGNWAENFR